MNERLSVMTHAASAALGRLSPRERRLILTFGALAVAAFVYLIVIEPVLDQRTKLEQRITRLNRELEEMASLAARIGKLEADLGRKTGSGRVSDGFSLFSFMDRATSASVSAEAIASMNPSRRKLPEGLVESVVEMRVQDVPLAEVVALLQQVEAASEPVYVKRLELKRRYDDQTRFDASLMTGALSAQ